MLGAGAALDGVRLLSTYVLLQQAWTTGKKSGPFVAVVYPTSFSIVCPTSLLSFVDNPIV